MTLAEFAHFYGYDVASVRRMCRTGAVGSGFAAEKSGQTWQITRCETAKVIALSERAAPPASEEQSSVSLFYEMVAGEGFEPY